MKTLPLWPDPPFPGAGNAIHPVLGKGVVKYMKVIDIWEQCNKFEDYVATSLCKTILSLAV